MEIWNEDSMWERYSEYWMLWDDRTNHEQLDDECDDKYLKALSSEVQPDSDGVEW